MTDGTRTKIVYHANCYDGFTAAWAAQAALGASCELIPHTYGDPPLDAKRFEDCKVVFVDYSISREGLLAIEKVAAELTVYDHHATAEEALAGLEFCVFDMDRSGAGLAWDYLHAGAKRPWLIDYVEDRDLWRKALPDSDAVNEFIRSHRMTLANWDSMRNTDLGAVVNRGKAMVDALDAYVEKAIANAFIVTMPAQGEPAARSEMKVAIVNHSYERISDVLHELLSNASDDIDFAVAFFMRADGKWQFSLRSRPAGGDHGPHVHVGHVARTFGGGGHACAAGFELERLPKWVAGR